MELEVEGITTIYKIVKHKHKLCGQTVSDTDEGKGKEWYRLESSQKGLPRVDNCDVDLEGLVHLTLVKVQGSRYLCSGTAGVNVQSWR